MPETTDAGATPAAAGATPAQTTPVSPAASAATSSPATGDDYPEGTGDAGKRAIDRMKADLKIEADLRKAAERERDELKTAGQSESEKAIAAAKAAGVAEASEKFLGQIRRAEVRTALTGAGISASVLDLATKADEFAGLKVDEDGNVAGLEAALKVFKDSKPDLFAVKTTPKPGDAGLGPRGTPSGGGKDLNTFIREQAGRH